jgi:hypothetical protein
MEGSRRSMPEEKTVEGWNRGVLQGETCEMGTGL